MNVVLLSGDLMTVSRVEGAAKQMGATTQAVANANRAAELCLASDVSWLIVDLSLPELDIAALVSQVKAADESAMRIIAFGPHVHEERLATARDAGCDLVVSRGEFFARIQSILAA
jgi:DNA-binding response OmpR family regulator